MGSKMRRLDMKAFDFEAREPLEPRGFPAPGEPVVPSVLMAVEIDLLEDRGGFGDSFAALRHVNQWISEGLGLDVILKWGCTRRSSSPESHAHLG